MSSHRLVVSSLVALCCLGSSARAADHDAVVVTLTGVVPSGSFAWEHGLLDGMLALRVGYAVGPALRSEDSGSDMLFDVGHGPMLEASFMTRGEHRFEAALGLSLAFGEHDGARELVAPSAFLGYRFQSADDPFLFRIGAGWSHWGSLPLSASFGFTF